MSEDVNIEHLLNISTSTDANSDGTWDACAGFIVRLSQHKPRLVTLGSNIEGLPDYHPSKPQCMLRLSQLLQEVGSYEESKRLLAHLLKLWRDRGNLRQVALTLMCLANVGRVVGPLAETMQLTKEALEMTEQLKDTDGQATCLSLLALLFLRDNQFNKAEETAFRSITLLRESSNKLSSRPYWVLGEIYRIKGNREKAVGYFQTALGLAYFHNQHCQSFWIHHSLVTMFADACDHLEQSKLYAVNNASNLAHVMTLQTHIFYLQGRSEEARSQGLCAIEAFESVGATTTAEVYRDAYSRLEQMGWLPCKPNSSSERLTMLSFAKYANPQLSAGGIPALRSTSVALERVFRFTLFACGAVLLSVLLGRWVAVGRGSRHMGIWA